MVFGDVRFHPLDHARNVLGARIPAWPAVALHVDADHAVLGGPAADVVVERVGFFILKLDLVAAAARNIYQHRARSWALVRAKDIDDVLWIGTKRRVAYHGDARVHRRRAAGDVVGRHQRPVELRRARRIDDVPHLHQSRFDIGRNLGLRRYPRERKRE